MTASPVRGLLEAREYHDAAGGWPTALSQAVCSLLELLPCVCATGHGKYRDKGPDGGFRIRR
jgi:hypothetical protein